MRAEARNWFVAQLKPNGLTRAQRNLTRQGFKHFCPTRAQSTTRQGKLVDRQKPLFPGYIFVQFDPGDSRWHAINGTRGISRLIVNDVRSPTPLPASLMAGLTARFDSSGRLLSSDEFQIGEDVRLIAGPFADFVSRVETLTDGERMTVLIDLLGQQVRTTVEKNSAMRL